MADQLDLFSKPATGDDGERDTIATDLTSTLFVEAGAGTGKTTALVSRVLELIASGDASIHQIAAITFTEAAASELRDRVREALERAAATEPDPDRAARCAAGGVDVDQAALTTLHGFAQRILTDHALEAGLPPRISVRDELRSTMAFDERWRGTVDRLVDDAETRRAVARAWCAGITFTHLRSLARQLTENWDLVADWDPSPPPRCTPLRVGPLLDLLGRAHTSVQGRPADDALVRLLTGFAEAEPAIATASSATDDPANADVAEIELVELLLDLAVPDGDKGVGQKGKKSSWEGDVDEGRALADAIFAEVRRLRRQSLHEALDVIIVALRATTLDDAAVRRRDGDLEFHDLLVLARDVVRTSAETRSALRRQFTRILVDEFQDTDPIQAELAIRLATPDGHLADTDGEIEPGRLFFVGDAQQAIYRFRRADIALFGRLRGQVTDSPIALRANFRSVPGVIDWVNTAFADLFGEGVPGVQPAHQPLLARRTGPDTGTAVHRIGGAAAPRTRVASIRARQADDVARAIRTACDEPWLVDDGRPIRLGDICVLLPTRTGLPALERAFDEHAITYRVDASSLVFQTQEVRDLLNALRAVDDPTNEVAVVAALRTPMFGCGDDDLLRWHADGRRWEVAAPDASGPVADGLRRLAAWRARARWASVSELVELLVRDGRIMEVALAQRRPRDVWRRLRYIADQARLFADDGGTTLRAFLTWMDLQADEDSRVVEAVLPESDDDAVRVMTVHASKGLEFPMVILTGLERSRRRETGVQLRWADGRPECHVRAGLATAGFAALDAAERASDLAEQRRLLYVAATRARDQLVVAMHHAVRADGSPVDCHAADLADIEGLPWSHLDLDGAETRRPAAAPATAPGPSADHEPTASATRLHEWQHARTLARSHASRPATRSPSQLAETITARDDTTEPHEGRSDRQRGRGGTAVGRAVHATLQLVDLTRPDSVDALATAQSAAEGVGNQADLVASMARRAMAHDLLRAAADGRHWRELYLGAPVGDTVLEGFVDLLLETERGLVVVDYKTDAVRDAADLDERVSRHRLQAAAYAELVETTLRRPVVDVILLFVATDPATARAVPDLGSARADVHELLGTSNL